ncbi:extracellular solute-binding protein [Paenibacillus thermotolerans]|uniref:extracellular solute-binding protein n=1 Tax=Paenibacillus thermotolerans TaxID=3027807 RepID=UPI002368AB42|nr:MULTISPECIES: extracellular solute-binding protein [unclassified Paenibacillus]
MKTASKLLSIALIVVLAFTVVACSGGNDSASTPNDSSSDNTSEKTQNDNGDAKSSGDKLSNFSIWTWLGTVEVWGGKSYDEVLAYQEMEKRTGVKVNYIHPTGDAVEAFNLMMTSGEMADAIWYSWRPDRTAQYYEANRIIDIYPLVKEHAPNLMNLIENDPQLKKQLIDPQGRMYYMPWITKDRFLAFGEGMVMREDWLKQIGKDVPKTNEELYETLKAMKAAGVSGGKPFVGLTGYPGQMYKLFYGFGVADDWFLEDGKVVYGPTSPRYKEALKWFKKMYDEGFIDKDYLTNEQDIYFKHLVDGQSAGIIDNIEVAGTVMKMAADAGAAFKFIGVPYMQYEGKSVSLNSTAKRIAQPYGLAIASTAKHPEQIVEYLDYGYSEPGQILFNWGIEGDTFLVAGGKKTYTDKIMKATEYVPGVEMTKYANPAWLTVTDPDYAKALLDDEGLKIREIWADVDISKAFEPILYLTKAENEIVANTSTDIATFKNEMRDSFITGQKDIDQEWDKYVETLRSMGIDELQQVQQSAYDRFMNQ